MQYYRCGDKVTSNELSEAGIVWQADKNVIVQPAKDIIFQ